MPLNTFIAGCQKRKPFLKINFYFKMVDSRIENGGCTRYSFQLCTYKIGGAHYLRPMLSYTMRFHPHNPLVLSFWLQRLIFYAL